MHINVQPLCTTHKILEPKPLLFYKDAFKMVEFVATNIDYDKLERQLLGHKIIRKATKQLQAKVRLL